VNIKQGNDVGYMRMETYLGIILLAKTIFLRIKRIKVLYYRA